MFTVETYHSHSRITTWGKQRPKGRVAHIRWDSRPVVRRIVRWVDDVGRGKEEKRQTLTKAEFVEGGTVGSAPK